MNRIAIIGACGGIGQPLSLLLRKYNLELFDVSNVMGVAADLSHVDSKSNVVGHKTLQSCLQDVDVVVCPAGVPRKPGMTRDDLFNINATIVSNIAKECAQHCPNALFLIISNPVNSTVPIFVETLSKTVTDAHKKVMGVTTLDLMRATKFLAQEGADLVHVPVVGGHSGPTIVPLLSQVKEASHLDKSKLMKLVNRIQYGGDEVVKAKDGTGSATLSMAVAGARFVNSVIEGKPEFAFVYSNVLDGVSYFSSKVEIKKDGISKIHDIGPISSYEEELLSKCIPELKANIQKGIDFVNK